jgi:hypothetical protein
MSSMLSAPATMPATRAVTFPPALAPLSAGTLRCRSANTASPASVANLTAGTRPADDTRFRSSNTADFTGRV